ncbi:uncharacterized protein METZ01_LOCUS426722, partial [marine metagenome]|jgi:hypothetical protein|tara:strand:+ start:2223 stop:2597 length:375 start_codon:yes stop_codon:yes gene_type:complete
VSEPQKDFNQDYLAEKLQSIGNKLDDAYGEPLLDELITRMERTVAHFNEEVDGMVRILRSRTKNQRGLLASMRGEDPNAEPVEMSDLEKKLESSGNGKDLSNKEVDEETPKKKKFSLFKRKKKK